MGQNLVDPVTRPKMSADMSYLFLKRLEYEFACQVKKRLTRTRPNPFARSSSRDNHLDVLTIFCIKGLQV